MVGNGIRKTTLALGVAAATMTAIAPAFAQDYPPPPPGYQGGPDQGPDQGGPQGPYQGGPDQGPYQGGPAQGPYNVPPPPGYQASDAAAEESPQAREQDERYSYEAERWAAANCVAAHQNNTAAGAVIGGILGAFIGAGVAGRYNRGAGAVVGAGLGGVTGAAIGNSAANSAPNCPPGYALREGAPAFYAGPVYGPVVYAAPGWYDPWVWYGGHWLYRPYPYHRYWYGHHR
jgi:hypothetical protein